SQNHSTALGGCPGLLRHGSDFSCDRGHQRRHPTSKTNGSWIQELRLLQNRRLPASRQTQHGYSSYNLTPNLSTQNSDGPQFFPIGTGLFNIVNLRAHWDKVPVPGSNGQKVSESEFYTHTPGSNNYLVNFHV